MNDPTSQRHHTLVRSSFWCGKRRPRTWRTGLLLRSIPLPLGPCSLLVVHPGHTTHDKYIILFGKRWTTPRRGCRSLEFQSKSCQNSSYVWGFLSVQRYHRTYSSGKIRLGSYWLRKIGIDMIAFLRARIDIRLRIMSMRIGNRRMRIWCRLPIFSYCRWRKGWILRISRDGNIGIYMCGGIGLKVLFDMGFLIIWEMPLNKFYF